MGKHRKSWRGKGEEREILQRNWSYNVFKEKNKEKKPTLKKGC